MWLAPTESNPNITVLAGPRSYGGVPYYKGFPRYPFLTVPARFGPFPPVQLHVGYTRESRPGDFPVKRNDASATRRRPSAAVRIPRWWSSGNFAATGMVATRWEPRRDCVDRMGANRLLLLAARCVMSVLILVLPACVGSAAKKSGPPAWLVPYPPGDTWRLIMTSPATPN